MKQEVVSIGNSAPQPPQIIPSPFSSTSDEFDFVGSCVSSLPGTSISSPKVKLQSMQTSAFAGFSTPQTGHSMVSPPPSFCCSRLSDIFVTLFALAS